MIATNNITPGCHAMGKEEEGVDYMEKATGGVLAGCRRPRRELSPVPRSGKKK